MEANKKAVAGVKSSVVKLFEIFQETEKKRNADIANIPNIDVTSIEKKLDEKLTVFMEAYETKIEEKIKRIGQAFDSKFNHMMAVVPLLKENTQKQINSILQSLEEYSPSPEVESPEMFWKVESLEKEFQEYRTEFFLWRESQKISIIEMKGEIENRERFYMLPSPPPVPPPPTIIEPPGTTTTTKTKTTQTSPETAETITTTATTATTTTTATSTVTTSATKTTPEKTVNMNENDRSEV